MTSEEIQTIIDSLTEVEASDVLPAIATGVLDDNFGAFEKLRPLLNDNEQIKTEYHDTAIAFLEEKLD